MTAKHTELFDQEFMASTGSGKSRERNFLSGHSDVTFTGFG